MITNPEAAEATTLTELDVNKSPDSSAASTTASNPASASGDQLLMPANPFENHGQRYEDDFEVPPMPHEQQQQQQQQMHYYQQQQQQQHAGYYHQQQQYYQQQQQHHQQQSGYYNQHEQYQQQQQQAAAAAAQQYHGMYHAGGGGMYPPPPQGATAAAAVGYHNGTNPPNNATPSPTTNSDDSGGDCVNESKQRLMHAQTVHPQQAAQQPPHPHAQPNPISHPYYHHMGQRGVPVVQKRPRQTRRSKKKRDPNEPQKPVSAYALFFRDMQAGIKVRNPNASFGEVSKHVASMWDNLDPDHKAAYKKRTENAKKEYLKSLAAYRANMVSKNGNSIEPYGPYSAAYNCFNKSGEYSGTTYANSSGEMIQHHNRVGVGSLGSPGSSNAGSGPDPVGNNNVGVPSGYGSQMAMRQAHHLASSSSSSHGHHSPSTVSPRSPGSSGEGSCHHQPTYSSPPHSSGGGPPPLTSVSTSSGDDPTTLPPGSATPSCRRPGCSHAVTDYGMNGFCSNDCVLSQSREIYNSWSSNGTAAVAGGAPGVGIPHSAPVATAAAGGRE